MHESTRIISLTIQEIVEIIKPLNKACGTDEISHELLKHIVNSVGYPLPLVFNKSIHSSTFPS